MALTEESLPRPLVDSISRPAFAPKPLLLWTLAATGSALLAVYAVLVGTPTWEASFVRLLQGVHIPAFHELNMVLTRVGHTPWALPLTAAAVTTLWMAGHARLGWFLALLTTGRVVGGVIKLLVDRARPDEGQVDLAYLFGGPSFPSGHVLGTTLLLGWLIYASTHVIRERTRRLIFQGGCLLVIALMGLSRIELGAHWPTDVLAGYLIAGVMLIPAMSAHRSMIKA